MPKQVVEEYLIDLDKDSFIVWCFKSKIMTKVVGAANLHEIYFILSAKQK